MVNKNLLKQYTHLKKECEELREKIQRLEKQLARIEEDGEVADKVRGGAGGIQSFKIKGFPFGRQKEIKRTLNLRKIILTNREIQLNEMINDVECFISSIDDSYIRRLLSLRVIDGLPWLKVANKMGGDNTEDSVRKAYDRYLEKNT